MLINNVTKAQRIRPNNPFHAMTISTSQKHLAEVNAIIHSDHFPYCGEEFSNPDEPVEGKLLLAFQMTQVPFCAKR